VLRHRYLNGGGIPWQPRGGGKETQRTLGELERAGLLRSAGRTRGQAWRFTDKGDEQARALIGAATYAEAGPVLHALIDLHNERGERWAPEPIIGRRLGYPGATWGAYTSDDHAMLSLALAPLFVRGLAEWSSTPGGHVIYTHTTPHPIPSAPDVSEPGGEIPEERFEAWGRGWHAAGAAVRKLNGPGFDGETGPTPAITAAPCMKGYATYA